VRIAYVCADRGIPVTGNSGSSVHVCELVKALTARGHDVTVFAADPGPATTRCEPVSIIDLGDDPVLEELRARIAKSLRLQEMCDAMGGLLKPLPTSSSSMRGIAELRALIIKEILAQQETVWDESLDQNA